ncbi:hypothetical protein N5V55_11530 [Escherichia coli]|nr:hypothetical protein [Escherichia coli]
MIESRSGNEGTIFAVALNHRSQLDAWQEAFNNPYKAPPKTAVWFIDAQYGDWLR